MPIVSFSINEQILQKFENALTKRGYSTKSEGFRDALRNFIDEIEFSEQEGENNTVLTILYDENEIDKGELSLIQHKYKEISAMLHFHIDEINCLEVLIAKGNSERIKSMISEIRKIKKIKDLKFITTASGV